MAIKQNNALIPISGAVWRELTKLSQLQSHEPLPVNLEKYAQFIGVQNIRFNPLISDAGIAKKDNGFEIIINTEAPGIRFPPNVTVPAGDGNWSKFQAPLRFTVAHEIAHVFFIRAAQKANKDELLNNQENRADIEEGCKILARLMLLPRQSLIHEAGESLLAPDHVSELITAFQVSPEVFFRRFHLSDLEWQSGELDGFTAFVREENEQLRLRAGHVFGKYAIDRFNQALMRAKGAKKQRKYEFRGLSNNYRQIKWEFEGMALNEIITNKKINIESTLRNMESGQIEFEVGWGDEATIPCSFAFRQIHQKPLGFLIALRVVGHVKKISQSKLL